MLVVAARVALRVWLAKGTRVSTDLAIVVVVAGGSWKRVSFLRNIFVISQDIPLD